MSLADFLFRKNFHLVLHDNDLDQDVDYMTKYNVLTLPEWKFLGRFRGATLKLHHFYQGEPETDVFHDHEFTFWTFPLSPYREGVIDANGYIVEQTVPAFRITRRDNTEFHVAYGRWHDAGKYDAGAINKYKSFWTIVLSAKKEREFSVARFEHPDELSYTDASWAEDFDPKLHWRRHRFDPVKQVEEPGVPLF